MRHQRGLVDTSVVIDLERIDPRELPLELALSVVTMAELAAGPVRGARSGCNAPRQYSSRCQSMRQSLARTGASTPRWRDRGVKCAAAARSIC
jgi:predicted nucleic acid-binding protein